MDTPPQMGSRAWRERTPGQELQSDCGVKRCSDLGKARAGGEAEGRWEAPALERADAPVGGDGVGSQQNQFRGHEGQRRGAKAGEGKNQPGKTHSQETANSILRKEGKVTRWTSLGWRGVGHGAT